MLFQEICPRLSQGSLLPAKEEEPADLVPVPQKVLRLVEQDERSLVEIQPEPIVIHGEIVEPQRSARRGLAIGLIAGLALMYLLLTFVFPPKAEQVIATSAPQIAEVTVVQQATVVVTATPDPQQQAAVVVTATNEPPTPTVEIVAVQPAGFVFSDDFEDGPDPLWKTIYGDVGMANGKLTVTAADQDRHLPNLAVLSGYIWQNFSVSMDLDNFASYFATASNKATGGIILNYIEGKESVGVFYSPEEYGIQLGLLTPTGGLVPIEGSLADGGDAGFDLGEGQNTLRVDAANGTYKVFVNSIQVTSATIKTEQPGEIALWFLTSMSTNNVEAYSPRVESIRVEALP